MQHDGPQRTAAQSGGLMGGAAPGPARRWSIETSAAPGAVRSRHHPPTTLERFLASSLTRPALRLQRRMEPWLGGDERLSTSAVDANHATGSKKPTRPGGTGHQPSTVRWHGRDPAGCVRRSGAPTARTAGAPARGPRRSPRAAGRPSTPTGSPSAFSTPSRAGSATQSWSTCSSGSGCPDAPNTPGPGRRRPGRSTSSAIRWRLRAISTACPPPRPTADASGWFHGNGSPRKDRLRASRTKSDRLAAVPPPKHRSRSR